MTRTSQFGVLSTLLVVVSGSAPGQERGQTAELATPKPEARTERTLRPEVETLINTAQAQPVEYFADVTFRILASEPNLDPALKTELLTTVFDRAGSTVQRHHLTYLFSDRRFMDIYHLTGASNLGLDELSIRLKVIREMARLDSKLALEWLETISSLVLPAAGCDSLAVSDTDALFEFLATSAGPIYRSHSREDDYYDLLARHLSGISSPIQMPAAAKLLAEVEIPQDRFAELLGIYTRRLAEVRGDDTSFAIAVIQGTKTFKPRTTKFSEAPLLDEIERLVKRLVRLGEVPDTVLQACRRFLAAHLQAPRCADGVRPVPIVTKGEDPYRLVVKRFNEGLRPYGSTAVAPLTEEETRPDSIDTSASPPEMNLEQDLRPCLIKMGKGVFTSTDRPENWKETLDYCLSLVDRFQNNIAMKRIVV